MVEFPVRLIRQDAKGGTMYQLDRERDKTADKNELSLAVELESRESFG